MLRALLRLHLLLILLAFGIFMYGMLYRRNYQSTKYDYLFVKRANHQRLSRKPEILTKKSDGPIRALYWPSTVTFLNHHKIETGGCVFSKDFSLYNQSDIFIVYSNPLFKDGLHLPNYRPPGQVWMLLIEEAPTWNYFGDINRFNGMF